MSKEGYASHWCFSLAGRVGKVKFSHYRWKVLWKSFSTSFYKPSTFQHLSKRISSWGKTKTQAFWFLCKWVSCKTPMGWTHEPSNWRAKLQRLDLQDAGCLVLTWVLSPRPPAHVSHPDGCYIHVPEFPGLALGNAFPWRRALGKPCSAQSSRG